MTDQQLHEYCLQWRKWCLTRKYFIAPGGGNFLARMQPSRVMPEKDAPMSAEMSHFHTALHALADMEPEDAKCFNAYYCYSEGKKTPVKTEAHKQGISRETFYQRKMRFARKALSLAQSLKRLSEEQEESPAVVD